MSGDAGNPGLATYGGDKEEDGDGLLSARHGECREQEERRE